MTRDDAVVGEAAGLSMGLVMLGTHSPQAIEDMTNVSEKTVLVFVLIMFVTLAWSIHG